MNYNDWLDKLKEYWLNKEVSKIVGELFATNVIYYETPFDKVDDITTVWNDILEQNIISLEYKIIGIKDSIIIANFIMKLDTNYLCDMVYEIKLDDNNKCTYFKQWYMGRN